MLSKYLHRHISYYIDVYKCSLIQCKVIYKTYSLNPLWTPSHIIEPTLYEKEIFLHMPIYFSPFGIIMSFNSLIIISSMLMECISSVFSSNFFLNSVITDRFLSITWILGSNIE
jgi:hypothetical protein